MQKLKTIVVADNSKKLTGIGFVFLLEILTRGYSKTYRSEKPDALNCVYDPVSEIQYLLLN